MGCSIRFCTPKRTRTLEILSDVLCSSLYLSYTHSFAISTLLGLAFGEMNLHRVFLRVDADNGRGIRCYEKAGFRQEGTSREVVFKEGTYHDQYAMSILRSEFDVNE